MRRSQIDNLGHVGGLCAGLLLGYAMCPVYSPHAVHEDEGDKQQQQPPPSPQQQQLPDGAAAPSEQGQQAAAGLQAGDSPEAPTFASSAEQATPEQLGPSPTREALLPHWATQHGSILPAQQILDSLMRGQTEIKEKDERSALNRYACCCICGTLSAERETCQLAVSTQSC